MKGGDSQKERTNAMDREGGREGGKDLFVLLNSWEEISGHRFI